MVSRTRLRALAAIAVLLPALSWAQGWIGLEITQGQKGVRVRGIIPNSPAEKGGIVVGEEVVAVNGEPTPNPRSLVASVQKAGVGGAARLKLAKEGHERTVALTVASRPSRTNLQRNSLVGQEAPNFTAQVRAGAPIGGGGQLSDLRGQVVLIDFFATWCRPCLAMLPHIERLHEKYGSKGLRVLGISTETAMVVTEARDRFRLKYTLISDEDESVSASYHVFALPTMVIIDKKGRVKEISVSDPELADAAIGAALKEP